MGIPPVPPPSAGGGGDLPALVALAIGIGVSIVGWLATRRVGAPQRSLPTRTDATQSAGSTERRQGVTAG